MIFFPLSMRRCCLAFTYCTIFLSGCIGSSAIIHEYTLAPLQPVQETVATAAAVSILLMPVLLPPPNNRTGIVTRLSSNSITTSSTHLWAGTLQEQTTATLAEDIRRQATGNNIQIYPGSRYGTPELLVEVRLLRFDGSIENDFTCTAVWIISDNQAGERIEQKKFSITVPVDSNNYSGYVQAASTTLVHLSKDINLSLQKIRSTP